MTIDEAIKALLEEDTQHPTASFLPELRAAERLGIEALRRVKGNRLHGHVVVWQSLPGETEE